MTVEYPDARRQLLELESEDQAEIRGHHQLLKGLDVEQKRQKNDSLATHARQRTAKMLKILKEIKEPTVENIGIDGSKAVAVLALHSNLDVMKKILTVYETVFRTNPRNIYFQAIPPLTDRIMIIEKREQSFGTNWAMSEDGGIFLVPVKDFYGMNERRARYALGPVMRPKILSKGAKKYPMGVGMAQKSDQKELTDAEYEQYSQPYLQEVR